MLLAVLLGTGGCTGDLGAPDYVARVGDRYLTRAELADAVAALPIRPDSAEASQQVIEQWVTNQLLFQEALDRGLSDEPEVKQLLEESRRSVLVSALISKMYEENPATPSPAELQAYYERNKEQMRLLEPFVRIRYLTTRSAAAAAEVRNGLARGGTDLADSTWNAYVGQYATDPDGARTLAQSYVAESRLFMNQQAARQALRTLGAGQVAPVFEADSLHHVLQLVARVPAGTLPEPAWIEEELTRRLVIESRKQLYARQVQRLRTEAMAREALEIRR